MVSIACVHFNQDTIIFKEWKEYRVPIGNTYQPHLDLLISAAMLTSFYETVLYTGSAKTLTLVVSSHSMAVVSSKLD